jgi:uncharacterized protein YndB with AHSA1/START domain
MRHEVTTTIAAPADLVWQTVADVAAWPEWTPTMTEVHRIDDGELREGSVARVRQPKQPLRTWTVTDLVPGRSFTWVSRGAGLRMTADHTVTPVDGGTAVELTFGMSGPLAPLVNLLAGKLIRAAVDTEAASLKARCERVSR